MTADDVPAGANTVGPVLQGLRIIEFPAFIAAPLGGLTLAQLGADVIRVDPPGGNIDIGRWPLNAKGRSLYWASLNRGKRSIEIDVRRPEGKFYSALPSSSVVIEDSALAGDGSPSR